MTCASLLSVMDFGETRDTQQCRLELNWHCRKPIQLRVQYCVLCKSLAELPTTLAPWSRCLGKRQRERMATRSLSPLYFSSPTPCQFHKVTTRPPPSEGHINFTCQSVRPFPMKYFGWASGPKTNVSTQKRPALSSKSEMYGEVPSFLTREASSKLVLRCYTSGSQW